MGTNKAGRGKALILLGVCCAAMAQGGCTAAFLDTATHGIFVQDEVNFAEQNYAAADYLIQQARHFVNKRKALITAMPLSDVKQPEMDSAFSRMVPEQIGVRLAQLGYRVDLKDVAANANYLSPGDMATQSPDFTLSGTFLRQRTDMNISVRLTDTRSGQVVGVFEYTLPLTRQVDDLARPKPKIVRMTP